MNLHDARALARDIQEVYGCACTVPYGHGPDGYFCRIWTTRPDDLDPSKSVPTHPVDFHNWDEAAAWFRRANALDEEYHRQLYAHGRRSPLDILIDRAVGLE